MAWRFIYYYFCLLFTGLRGRHHPDARRRMRDHDRLMINDGNDDDDLSCSCCWWCCFRFLSPSRQDILCGSPTTWMIKLVVVVVIIIKFFFLFLAFRVEVTEVKREEGLDWFRSNIPFIKSLLLTTLLPTLACPSDGLVSLKWTRPRASQVCRLITLILKLYNPLFSFVSLQEMIQTANCSW